MFEQELNERPEWRFRVSYTDYWASQCRSRLLTPSHRLWPEREWIPGALLPSRLPLLFLPPGCPVLWPGSWETVRIHSTSLRFFSLLFFSAQTAVEWCKCKRGGFSWLTAAWVCDHSDNALKTPCCMFDPQFLFAFINKGYSINQQLEYARCNMYIIKTDFCEKAVSLVQMWRTGATGIFSRCFIPINP